MADPTGPISVSIEELDASAKTPEPPQLDKIKLEGAAVPELLRGKTIAEVMQLVDGLSSSLRTSEQARAQAEQIARLQAERQPPPQKEPEPEPELTEEQLQELHEKDSLAAIRYMQDRAERRVARNVETRLGSLFTSTAAQLEQQMREKYKVEFELFGSDISRVLAIIPNKEQALSNPAAWEDVISMVRGREVNLKRYIEHQTAPTKDKQREEAREIEVQSVGFTDQSGGRTRLPASVDQMDDVTKEIARNLNFPPTMEGYKDYLKWAHIGNNSRI